MSLNNLIGEFSPEARVVRDRLVEFLKARKIPLQQGSMPTTKFERHPRLWEYATAVAFTTGLDGAEGKRVLDVGGANSALTWFLAELGAEVWSTDLLKNNVDACASNAKKFGYDNVHAVLGNVEDEFDFVYNINVIEHVMEHARVKVEKSFKPGACNYWGKRKPSAHEVETENEFVRYMADRVKPEGLLVITYAFARTSEFKCQPRCAYLRDEQDVIDRIVKPSGLKLHGGDLDMTDRKNVEKFHSPASTGIVFLRKP